MQGFKREQLEATIHLAVLSAYADGNLADAERDVLRECIGMHAGSEEEAVVMMAFVRGLPVKVPAADSKERAKRVEEIKAVLSTREEREIAFRLAVSVANAHDGIGLRESLFLLRMMSELEIPEAVARARMDSVLAGDRSKHEHAGSEGLGARHLPTEEGTLREIAKGGYAEPRLSPTGTLRSEQSES